MVGAAPKRIVLISQWFPPEHAPIGFMIKELAADLVRAGWDVTVVTGFPNHPSGIVFAGYRKQWLREEFVEGIRIRRVYLYTSPVRSPHRRILTFLSFTMSSWLCILLHARPDVVFSVLQPLSVGLTLPLLGSVKRFRLVFNVQDLHPDAPIELGLVRNRLLIWMLRRVERFAYRRADRLAVICEGFRRHCVAAGAPAERVRVIENWVDTEAIRPGSRIVPLRAEIGLGDEDFAVLYAGTIGLVSGAELVIETASLLREYPRIKMALVGEGPLVDRLVGAARKANLDNVVFAPFQPRDRVNEVQAMADLSIVTLLPGKGKLSVPSKVLGYMAAGRCVVCSADADSETARLVDVSGCGLVVEPGNAQAMADAILALQSNAARRTTMADNGRRYLERHLSRTAITRKYMAMLDEMTAERCSA